MKRATGCLDARHKKRCQPLNNKECAGTLSVSCVKVKDAAGLLKLDKQSLSRPEAELFIVFNRAEGKSLPVAYCCITDDKDVRQGITFASNHRFATESLISRYPDKRFLEISAFHMRNEDMAHRAKGLLWRAITNYCAHHAIDYVLGCFSFDGKYPAAHAMAFSYLYHYCQADPQLQVTANVGVSMDIMPAEAVRPDRAHRFLPPLLRYCLRLGARVSDTVAVDRNIDAMNVFLLLPARPMAQAVF